MLLETKALVTVPSDGANITVQSGAVLRLDVKLDSVLGFYIV